MSWKQGLVCFVISLIVALVSFGWLFVIAFGSGEILTFDKFLETSSGFAKNGDISGLVFLSGSFLVVIPVLLSFFLLEGVTDSFKSIEIPLVVLTTTLVVFIPLCVFLFIKNRMK